MKELIAIQKELKAPKNQKNSHQGYMYRSCEDILEAVKPICHKHNCLLTISDEMVMLGDRFYVKATATISNIYAEKRKDNVIESISSGDCFSVSAYAREQEKKMNSAGTKEIMDHSQLTGSASSYARKYALNGLFCIDDTKDADAMDNSSQAQQSANTTKFEEYKPLTVKQKGTLKDQIVELDSIGSESTLKAVTAINTFLNSNNPGFDNAVHLINKVKLTLEGAR